MSEQEECAEQWAAWFRWADRRITGDTGRPEPEPPVPVSHAATASVILALYEGRATVTPSE